MYTVTINSKLCKGCVLCADFCPKNVYDAKNGYVPTVARENDCIGCNICVMRCPDFAIKVEGEK